MVDEKTTKKKRGPKKGTTKKGKTTNSMMKSLQKVYDRLIEDKKEIDKKMKVHEKYCKEMGYKLSKRIMKIKDEIVGKPKGKRGRTKKEVVVPEGKSE